MDVRDASAFASANRLLVGAIHQRPDQVVDQWRSSLPPGRPVIAYCKHGNEVSQSVTAALRTAGIDAAFLEGGIAAWKDAGLPTRRNIGVTPGKWVTRERPKIDRIACPWLISRFIDPQAEFVCVEPITEMGTALVPPGPTGMANAINFQPTGGGKAAITGDFLVTGDEVNPLIRTLRANGIEVTAIHSHMLDEQPRMFFIHFWANDDAQKLAKGTACGAGKNRHRQRLTGGCSPERVRIAEKLGDGEARVKAMLVATADGASPRRSRFARQWAHGRESQS